MDVVYCMAAAQNPEMPFSDCYIESSGCNLRKPSFNMSHHHYAHNHGSASHNHTDDHHDHDHDHPDETTPALQNIIWKQIDFEKIRTLNETESDAGLRVVKKSWAQRMDAEPELVSDADEQLLMYIP